MNNTKFNHKKLISYVSTGVLGYGTIFGAAGIHVTNNPIYIVPMIIGGLGLLYKVS